VKDFLTRVAERALGTAPRIDPQATSRYAPARLPLPEAPSPQAEIPAPPRVSRPRQFDREHELPKKVIAPSLEPTPEAEERINVPEQPRKFDQAPLVSARTPPVNELEPAPEITTERIIRNSVVPPEPHVPESNPISVLSSHAPSVDQVPDEFEAPEIPDPRNDSFPVRAASFADNKPEIQPQTRTLKIVERIIDETDEIAESVESSSPPPLEVVTRPREHQQPTRAAVSPIVVPPTATSDRRRDDRHERPERREKTIQVKIGRVEVHAPPAPLTPVEPPAPPGPKLSLADFLRQHNRRRDE
jgi:hypothetical protein